MEIPEATCDHDVNIYSQQPLFCIVIRYGITKKKKLEDARDLFSSGMTLLWGDQMLENTSNYF